MMNLLCMTKYQILRILRKKVWISLLITGIIITLACFYYPFVVNEAPIAIMSQTVFGQAMLTLSFMMMGIELRREDSQEHIDDLATTYLKYTEKQPWSQIMVICALAIGVTVLLCVGCLIPLLLDGAPLNWILQTMAQIALVFFLPCLILGIWGMVAQLAIPGKNVYLPAVVLWLLTSSLTIYFTEALGEHYEQWRLISGAFCMGFNNYQMYQNVVTGMKNEIPRWVMRSLCAFFIAAGYILVYKQKCISTKRQKIGKKIRNGAIAIMAVVLMASMLVRYSEFFTAFADDTYTQKIVYEKGAVYQPGDNVSLEDWPTEKNITLKKTDIRISCTTQGIQADVLITATADKTIENQTFTLFSDFEIDEVRVDEKTTTFERSNDGIMVYFPDAKQAGDMLRRLGIAQAVLGEPDLLILDEPSVGLDPAERINLRKLIREYDNGERIILLSSHIVGDIESLCKFVTVMNRGSITQSGTLSEIRGVAKNKVVEDVMSEEDFRAVEESHSIINFAALDTGYKVRYLIHSGEQGTFVEPTLEDSYTYIIHEG